MSCAQRAATLLLGGLMTMIAGCRGVQPAPLLASADRARLFSTVLGEVRRDSDQQWVLLDTLLPTTDIEADQYDMVTQSLALTVRDLRAFLMAQHLPTERVAAGALPDRRWSLVSAARLDSLRTLARRGAASGVASSGARGNSFWQQWFREYPASGGYVVLSPVAVSDGGRRALVQVRIACGPVCGESELRVMRRDARGVWRTTARVRLSES